MIVLHAGFYQSQFILWGETQGEAPVSPVVPGEPRDGNDRLILPPPPSPFAADPYDLLAAMKSSGTKLDPDIFRATDILAWLPSSGNLPVPSSPLIAELQEGGGSAVLAPWTVFGLQLMGPAVLDLLCRCWGKHMLGPGVSVGPDLAFWCLAMRFAGAMVARQRFLPGIRQELNFPLEPII